MIYFLFFIPIIFLILAAAAFLFFSIIPVLQGAPFVPVHSQRLKKAFDVLNLKPGQKIADLGSGDGKILIEAAKRGIKSVGFEINPILVFLTKRKIKKQKLQNLAFCKWQSFWKSNLFDFDVVFVFGISHIMKSLEKKFEKELKTGAKAVCFVFPLPPHQTKLWCGGEPNWQPIFAENGVYIYERMVKW